MKGITPVIAVILMLLITVSLTAFVYVWFTRVSTAAALRIENQTQKLLTTKSLRIENAKDTAADLRNTGAAAIDNSEIAAFIEDARTTITCPGSSIAPGSVVTCTLAAACPVNGRLRISIADGADVVTCV